VTATEGDREIARCVAVVEILGRDAKVLALFHAGGAC